MYVRVCVLFDRKFAKRASSASLFLIELKLSRIFFFSSGGKTTCSNIFYNYWIHLDSLSFLVMSMLFSYHFKHEIFRFSNMVAMQLMVIHLMNLSSFSLSLVTKYRKFKLSFLPTNRIFIIFHLFYGIIRTSDTKSIICLACAS